MSFSLRIAPTGENAKTIENLPGKIKFFVIPVKLKSELRSMTSVKCLVFFLLCTVKYSDFSPSSTLCSNYLSRTAFLK